VDVLGFPIVPRSRFCPRRGAYVARYDHYCPWLGEPIGERNLRWFFAFLVALLAASALCLAAFSWFFWLDIRQFPQRSAARTVRIALAFGMETKDALASWLLALAMSIALLTYVADLVYRISRNLTVAEFWQNPPWRRSVEWVNAYDKGVVQNWRDTLFPPPVVPHAPFPE
jgi:hypothetical protein